MTSVDLASVARRVLVDQRYVVSRLHRQALIDHVVPLDTEDLRAVYRRREIPRAETVKDLNQRYRWDLLWKAEAAERPLGDGPLRAVLHAGYASNQIDSVLRALIPPINQQPYATYGGPA